MALLRRWRSRPQLHAFPQAFTEWQPNPTVAHPVREGRTEGFRDRDGIGEGRPANAPRAFPKALRGYVRLTPNSDARADVPGPPLWAIDRLMHGGRPAAELSESENS